jgi:frataxin-like iron-binding protein CyaY
MCWWSLISICARSWYNIQYFLFTISDCGFPVTRTNNHEQMETQRNDNHCVDETRWWNPAMTITARSRSEPDLIRCPCAMRLVHWISLHKTGQCYATKLARWLSTRRNYLKYKEHCNTKCKQQLILFFDYICPQKRNFVIDLLLHSKNSCRA